jgi:hypothetical protein
MKHEQLYKNRRRAVAGIGAAALVTTGALVLAHEQASQKGPTASEKQASNAALAQASEMLDGVLVVSPGVALHYSPEDAPVDMANAQKGNVKRYISEGEQIIAHSPVIINEGTDNAPDVWDEFHDIDGTPVYVHTQELQQSSKPLVTRYVFQDAQTPYLSVKFNIEGHLTQADPKIVAEYVGYSEQVASNELRDHLMGLRPEA